MRREIAIARLRSLEPRLRDQGLAHLYLFGSVARGDAGSESDIDLAFDIEPAFQLEFSLIDQSRITRQLAEALNGRVDFVQRDHLRPRLTDRSQTGPITLTETSVTTTLEFRRPPYGRSP
jgi:predicted nucleotidyltransferase